MQCANVSIHKRNKLELILLNPNHRSPSIQNNLAKNVFSAKNPIAVIMLKVFVCVSKK